MARQPKWRVLGPYRERRGRCIEWRIVSVSPSGRRESSLFRSEGEAIEAKELQLREYRGEEIFEDLLVKYREHMITVGNGPKGACKPKSAHCTIDRLTRWLPVKRSIRTYSEKDARAQYQRRVDAVAVDSHRGELAEVKTFFRWCVKQGVIDKSPVEGIVGVGRRRKGRVRPLTRSETRAWASVLAAEETDVATGLLLAMHNLSSSEIRNLRVRDLDLVEGEDAELYVASDGDGKTASRTRTLEGLPPELVTRLAAIAGGRSGEALLFPADDGTVRDPSWLRQAAERLAKRHGLRYVGVHGFRSTWGALQRRSCVSLREIADAMGHSPRSTKTTLDHYVQREAEAVARRREAAIALDMRKEPAENRSADGRFWN